MAKSRTARHMLAAALALAAGAPALGADEARVFAPASGWQLSSDSESCWITRRFGVAKDVVALSLQGFSPGEAYYSAVLSGAALPQRDSGSLEFETRFNTDLRALSHTGVLARSGGVYRLTFTTTLESTATVEARREGESIPVTIDSAREAAIEEFVVSFSRGRPLLLQLGSMAEPLEQLRRCTAALVEGWGLDPAVQQSRSRPPVPIEQDKWLGPGTYPWAYLRAYRSVMVRVRLMIDESGAATQCIVQSPRNENNAGVIACREIMKTARFEPALDASGNPVPSYFATLIFYHTPRRNGNW